VNAAALQAVFSHGNDEWSTPQYFFDRINERYQLELDVCATRENAKCELFYDPDQDGLAVHWAPYRCWMNPPYSQIRLWMAKACEEAQRGALVVCLVPSRTDTAWWHDFVIPHGEVEFVRGRLKFGGSKNSAPFPSAVVVFR
jgi:phage N-6-adenine-methyltransferase